MPKWRLDNKDNKMMMMIYIMSKCDQIKKECIFLYLLGASANICLS